MSSRITREEIQRVKRRFGIIGNSEGLNRAIEVALLIAPTDVSVLVTGESGVGKESFPQIIHNGSSRKHGPYVAVNCGAIPEGTIDSELFGHKKGSFTDAVTERKGYFEVADGGTIFLDEIGELPIPTQARLLRVLESGEFMKVGSSEVQRTDIRVVAATNVNLQRAIEEGHFRQDLFYRLNTVTIELPPLRDREGDAVLLFRKFASDFGDKYHMPPIRLSDEAEELLLRYAWPGNIRQLRNLVERLSVIAEDREISREVLLAQLPANAEVRHPAIIVPQEQEGFEPPLFGQKSNATQGPTLATLHAMMLEMNVNLGELTQLLYQILSRQKSANNTILHSLPEPQAPFARPNLEQHELPLTPKSREVVEILEEVEELLNSDEVLTLEEMELKYIEMVLKKNNGARRKTADDLNISERTLYRKLSKAKD